MPLMYDDIPGSWGMYSQDWPKIVCENKEEADRAFVACSLEKVIPYGSYVRVDNEIRVETTEMLSKLKVHLVETTLTHKDVLEASRAELL